MLNIDMEHAKFDDISTFYGKLIVLPLSWAKYEYHNLSYVYIYTLYLF